MWKGLKKLIFNTDIDDISEEGTLSDIELPKKEKEKPDVYMEAPLKEAVQASPETDNKPFTGINADVEKPKEKKVVKENVRPRKENKADSGAEYEFRPVLSPIYGNMKESEKEPKDVHDAIHLPKAKTKNPLNTVLSPMYGEYELETFEKEAKATISKRREKELQIESAFVANDAAEAEEEEVLTLDEMLSVDEEEDANEPVQISLFGESTPIKEVAAGEETIYQKKE
ncbi:hypothetical protein QUV96_01030 [Amedibacillus dolichus]|uniref:Internalin n=1 Tax=Amedibacillus dolichus TaxID=31971 RepID=A0ABT7U997_9FIRM|nr:hypothetical protein [Amedibacillus dolichus]MDM8156216.1 hypothetical protein [Amedibacillus dolichus]